MKSFLVLVLVTNIVTLNMVYEMTISVIVTALTVLLLRKLGYVAENDLPAKSEGEGDKENTGEDGLSLITMDKPIKKTFHKWLFLVMVQVPYLLLNGAKPSRFPAFVINAEYCTEFLVELRDTDGGQTDIGHLVTVRIQTVGKAPERISFSHAWSCGEQSNPTRILQVVESRTHLREVTGFKVIFFR